MSGRWRPNPRPLCPITLHRRFRGVAVLGRPDRVSEARVGAPLSGSVHGGTSPQGSKGPSYMLGAVEVPPQRPILHRTGIFFPERKFLSVNGLEFNITCNGTESSSDSP